jgi:predicted nucleic acid-binding protein
VKLAVEEAESAALLAAISGRRPYTTSVVGEIETLRVCRRAQVPAGQVDELRAGLVIIALDDEVRRLASEVGSPILRTLDAIHLATALSLGEDLESLVTYDLRLARATADAAIPVLTPT